jgi:hypothetical protein
MNKKVLSLIIVIAILMLAGWTSMGNVLENQEPVEVVSKYNQRSEAPDYFADGKFFNDVFLQLVTTDSRSWTADYTADAEIFYSDYSNRSLPNAPLEIPDYPLDGKFFVEHWSEMP